MKLMLDTNICIYIIKKKPAGVFERFNSYSVDDVCISSVTLAELEYGVHKSKAQAKNRVALRVFLSGLTVLPFDIYAAEEYGKIRTELESKGTPIGANDMLIAAHARSLQLTLITNNVKEFERVSGLQVENWF